MLGTVYFNESSYHFMKPVWQLQQSLDAIIFDCDGTLSRLEGIDELAVQNGVADVVTTLTAEAMTSTGVTRSLYQERLSLVKPRREQLERLGKMYFDQRTPDSGRVIEVLQDLGKAVFIMSAGLKLAVDLFAQALRIPVSHVYSVDIDFNDRGDYLDFDHESPLTRIGGKGYLVQQLKQRYPSIMHVGDGVNDLDAKEYVTRFVGYGGVFFRQSILKRSNFYIRSSSLTPVLALALTETEANNLSECDRALYDKGLALITSSEVFLT